MGTLSTHLPPVVVASQVFPVLRQSIFWNVEQYGFFSGEGVAFGDALPVPLLGSTVEVGAWVGVAVFATPL